MIGSQTAAIDAAIVGLGVTITGELLTLAGDIDAAIALSTATLVATIGTSTATIISAVNNNKQFVPFVINKEYRFISSIDLPGITTAPFNGVCRFRQFNIAAGLSDLYLSVGQVCAIQFRLQNGSFPATNTGMEITGATSPIAFPSSLPYSLTFRLLSPNKTGTLTLFQV